MKFTVERASLLAAVLKLQKVVGSKTAMPVLEGILISAEKGKVTLMAYNLEIGLKKVIYANCETEGDIVINARILSDILRKLGGAQVEISVEDEKKLLCKIKSGDAIFDIIGMAAKDFPEMPSLSDGQKLVLSGDLLTEMVKRTIFAVSPIEGTRPILTGINVSLHNGVFQFVALDGFRLAVRRQKLQSELEFEFIIAGKALSELVKLIEENDAEINMMIGQRLVSFEINGFVFISRLLEGEFVNFVKIIPEDYIQSCVFGSSELIDIVERVSLLINDSFQTPIRCVFTEEDLTISSATTMGRATETMLCKIEGMPFELGLNSRYLLDALRACDSGNVLFKFNGANGGITITSADKNNKDFLYLIMPMRIKK